MLKAGEERNERMPRSARQAYDFNPTASTATVQIVGKTVWMLIGISLSYKIRRRLMAAYFLPEKLKKSLQHRIGVVPAPSCTN